MTQLVLFLAAILTFNFLLPVKSFSQSASEREQIRIHLWAETDSYPGFFEDEDEIAKMYQDGTVYQNLPEEMNELTPAREVFKFAIKRMKENAEFLIGGMINGWYYDYTPYDKTRRVEEYFELTPYLTPESYLNNIEYHQPEIIDNRIFTWIYCNRTPSQMLSYDQWSAVRNPKIHGIGTGDVRLGFDGIEQAVRESVKNAVREYWRKVTKNKPKEISGTVLLIHEPYILVKDGKYVAELDFFMQTSRIEHYKNF